MPARSEPLAQRGHRRDEHDDVLSEAPAVVHGARAGVGRLHLEVEVLDALRGERLHDSVDEGGGDTAPACIGDDVQVGQPPQPRARSPREREPDRHAVALREECQARLDVADLADLPLHVVGDMGLRRHFQLELAPEALDRPRRPRVATRIVIARW